MAAVNPIPDETARKIVRLIFQRLSSVGQNTVAEALATSESTVSRLKESTPQFAAMLAKLGLKVVPAEVQCYDPKTLAAILELAKQRMSQIQNPQQLAQDWDEPE
jgi:ABC-type sugar transport system ATPase subunit